MLTKHSRGFVTIATGKDSYYQMAHNLLLSYRLYSEHQEPFAILCDRQNAYTKDFDVVIVLDRPYFSYLDKLQLYAKSPFEESIFVDADALFLRDPALLWSDFSEQDDFSCYGKALPLTSKKGWFYYEEMGELKAQLQFGVQMHGGLYYFRKTQRCREVFELANHFAEHYSKYRFAHFEKPADEPVLATAMAIHGCKPCAEEGRVLFLPSYGNKLKVKQTGEICIGKEPSDGIVLHIATSNTGRFVYQYLLKLIQANGKALDKAEYWKLRFQCLYDDIKIPFIRRIKRTVKYALPLRLRKKVMMLLKR